MGRVDEAGRVYITGRIKELIITAGGENVAPVPIEDKIKSLGEGVVSNCMMVGDRKKFNTLFVTLATQVDGEQQPTDQLDVKQIQRTIPGFTATTPGAANLDKEFEGYMKAVIEKYNGEAVSNAQKLQKYTVIPEFSVGTGELTPTMKLKRPIVVGKYQNHIDSMYGDATDPKTTYIYKVLK